MQNFILPSHHNAVPCLAFASRYFAVSCNTMASLHPALPLLCITQQRCAVHCLAFALHYAAAPCRPHLTSPCLRRTLRRNVMPHTTALCFAFALLYNMSHCDTAPLPCLVIQDFTSFCFYIAIIYLAFAFCIISELY